MDGENSTRLYQESVMVTKHDPDGTIINLKTLKAGTRHLVAGMYNAIPPVKVKMHLDTATCWLEWHNKGRQYPITVVDVVRAYPDANFNLFLRFADPGHIDVSNYLNHYNVSMARLLVCIEESHALIGGNPCCYIVRMPPKAERAKVFARIWKNLGKPATTKQDWDKVLAECPSKSIFAIKRAPNGTKEIALSANWPYLDILKMCGALDIDQATFCDSAGIASSRRMETVKDIKGRNLLLYKDSGGVDWYL